MIKVNNEIVEIKHFPDGTQCLLDMPVLPNGINSIRFDWKYENDEELATLYYLVNHYRDVVQGNCKYVLRVLYLPNGRMDRTRRDAEVFTLKYFSNLINSMNFDSVEVLDPHSYVAEALIDRIACFSPYDFAQHFIDNNFKDEIEADNFSLFFPDEGSCKRYAGMFNYPYTFGLKRRDWKTGEIQGLDVIGDETLIKNRTILIVDDICSRGKTFLKSAEKLKEMGADKVYLYVTHCENTILDGTLLNSGLIEKVFTTNTIFTKQHEMIEVYEL